MKRSGPPQRKSPMLRTGIRRGKPPVSGAGLRTGKPLRSVSSKRRKRDADYPAARELCHDLAGGRCARCGIVVALDVGHCHHRAGRLGPDPHRQENLVWLDPSCHAWCHERPAEAYATGLSVKRNGRGAA